MRSANADAFYHEQLRLGFFGVRFRRFMQRLLLTRATDRSVLSVTVVVGGILPGPMPMNIRKGLE